jgi:hypothetical protein
MAKAKKIESSPAPEAVIFELIETRPATNLPEKFNYIHADLYLDRQNLAYKNKAGEIFLNALTEAELIKKVSELN